MSNFVYKLICMQEHEDLSEQLQRALSECAHLREENARLKALLNIQPDKTAILPDFDRPKSTQSSSFPQKVLSNSLSPEAKITLFKTLFCGRDDVYALRWVSKNGRSGYSPAGTREWEQSADGTYKLKKDSSKRDYFPLTDEVIRHHLTGKCTIGIYPLLTDETCWFLAADFDKKTWQDAARAFLETCHKMGVPASLERSRSGNGGHVWIFFDRPVSAVIARKLGCIILTETMERRHQIGLDSYDRFFPNQDTMPKGGFGNLIALPLQHEPRARGNSVFLDENLDPYPDQWQFLSTIRRISADNVEAMVREASRRGDIIGVRTSLTDDRVDEDPWTLPPSKRRVD